MELVTATRPDPPLPRPALFPLYHCTTVPPHHCTTAPLYHCTKVTTPTLQHSNTPTLVCFPTCFPTCGSCACKSFNASVDGPTPVWDELFQTLSAADPYGRQMSIHNGALLYNHSRPWISHVSLQGREDDTPDLRPKYGKPVVWDEEVK